MSFKKTDGLDNPAFELTNGDTHNNGTIQNGGVTANEKPPNNEEEEEDRVQWGNSIEFLMSCIAMSVGLGNIWRFPFTAYENGGGAFLIPYIIILVIVGRPLYYLEMSLGQFTSRGNVKMFQSLSPAMTGVGYGQLMGAAAVATYYCSLMAIILFYLVNSFTADLPWASCWPEWNVNNVTCIGSGDVNVTIPDGNQAMSSSELYFRREVLREIDDISDGIGVPEWRLTLCLFISWLLTFLVSFKGVASSGKASYFLALFPYVIMIALLIRAVTLEGAGEGILFFIRPQWEKLLQAEVWYAAVTQCFFSLGVGFGSIVMYSSYNRFGHNINRDAMIVTTLDTFTSLLAGTTIFGILGNLAYQSGVEVNEVISSGGSGLAFISYPEAIARFDVVPWLFAILFFGMLFILGIGSLVALQNCANVVIMDKFTSLKAWQVSGLTALIGFLVGLVYVTPGGQFILNLVDFFAGTFVIFILAICEVAIVVWIYGLENICNDIFFMVQTKVGFYWRLTWGLVTPATLIAIFVYFLATLQRLTYGENEYPDFILAWGWVLLGVAMLQLALLCIYYIVKNRDHGWPRMICEAFSPSRHWGPKKTKNHEDWRKFKDEIEQERQNSTMSAAKRRIMVFFNRI